MVCEHLTNPPFTWHFESGLSHSHAQANPDSIGIQSRLNPDYRILVRRWIISGFRCEIAQSRSQAPERARKVGGKGDAYGASFPNSLKGCAGAAIIATIPIENKNRKRSRKDTEIVDRARRSGAGDESGKKDLPDDFQYYSQIDAVMTGRPSVSSSF